jgi:hypothetical protein
MIDNIVNRKSKSATSDRTRDSGCDLIADQRGIALIQDNESEQHDDRKYVEAEDNRRRIASPTSGTVVGFIRWARQVYRRHLDLKGGSYRAASLQ